MRLRRATRKGTRRRSSQQPVPRWAVAIMALCIVAGVGFVVARIQRHDAFITWRQSLEEGGRIKWPPWDEAWPKLPVRESTRRPPIDVTGAAAFAVRNAEMMQYVPCYCGACPADHSSNLSCYVTGFRTDGTPIWTDHASTCPICVNVTREVMLMVRQGRSLSQIRTTLDHEYGRAGLRPSTQSPHPPASD